MEQITIKIINSHSLSEQETLQEILLAEQRMNSFSKLRFHIIDPSETKLVKPIEQKSIGEVIAPILTEIETTLWNWETNERGKPNYPDDGFRAATKIFMSVIMDKMYDLQVKENMPLEEKIKMVEELGKQLRTLVKTFTDIDAHNFYK